jgi:DNA invertase Pin-like site-specific DNA recombinase
MNDALDLLPRPPGSDGRRATWTYRRKTVFHIFEALAEFERDIIRERTQAGLIAARARGRKGGRPKSLTGKKVAMVQELYKNKNNTIGEICVPSQ